MVIRIANFPVPFGPSGKHFRTETVPQIFMAKILFPSCQIRIRNCVLMLYAINKYGAKTAVCRFFSTSKCNVAYFPRKIQLFGFSTYPEVSSSQLIHNSRCLLCLQMFWVLPSILFIAYRVPFTGKERSGCELNL